MLAEFVTKHGDMRDQRADAMPLATVLVRYYEHQAKGLRSARDARLALGKWNDHFGEINVADLDHKAMSRFVDALRGQGLSEGYIRRVLQVGKAALNRAHKVGEVERIPTIDMSLAPGSAPRERVATLDELAYLYRAATEPHMRAYLTTALATGARPEAILELTTFQCDVRGRLVRLNPPGRRQNKKRRPTVPMAWPLAELVSGLPTGPVVSYRGGHLKSIRSPFDRTKERAAELMRQDGRTDDAEAIGEVTPYVLRHTTATAMRRRGVPVWEVAEFLGHSTGYRTTEMYAKESPEALGGALRGGGSPIHRPRGGAWRRGPLVYTQPSCVRAACD